MRQPTENERRRRENLRTLLSVGKWRSATELARALGVTKGTLSQLIGANPLRTISERTAREYEGRLGLPEGVLDMMPVRPSPAPDSPRVAMSQQPEPVLPPDAATQILDDVMRVVAEAGANLPPEKFRAAVMLLYRLTVRAGGVVDSADVSDIMKLAG